MDGPEEILTWDPDLSPRDVNESFAIAYIQTALICRLKISCIGPDFPYQLIAAIGLQNHRIIWVGKNL